MQPERLKTPSRKEGFFAFVPLQLCKNSRGLETTKPKARGGARMSYAKQTSPRQTALECSFSSVITACQSCQSLAIRADLAFLLGPGHRWRRQCRRRGPFGALLFVELLIPISRRHSGLALRSCAMQQKRITRIPAQARQGAHFRGGCLLRANSVTAEVCHCCNEGPQRPGKVLLRVRSCSIALAPGTGAEGWEEPMECQGWAA